MDAATLKAEGWRWIDAHGFSSIVGSIWLKGNGDDLLVGMLSTDRHANENLGTVHGGVLMTFADIAFGCAVAEAIGGVHCATVQLQLQFVASPTVGAFITCRPEVVRRTKVLVFLRGLISAEERTVGSADGLFRVFEPGAA
jgi:acyl-coenzyme A thioesterase PaaI-like protein